MALAQCPEHGDFLIRVRLSPETGGTFRVSRLTYQGDLRPPWPTPSGRKKPNPPAKPAAADAAILPNELPFRGILEVCQNLSANTVGMLQRKGAYQRCLICCYFCLLLPSQVSRRSP